MAIRTIGMSTQLLLHNKMPMHPAPKSYAPMSRGCLQPIKLHTFQPNRSLHIAYAQEIDSTPVLASGDDWVEIGIVGPSHGVRGEFKVQPLTDFPELRLEEPGARWLQAPTPRIGRQVPPTPEAVELEWGRRSIFKGREVWLVKLEGVDSPEEATLIKGHTLLIQASARDPLDDEDEFYVQELVGLKVELISTGEIIGTVVDLFDGTGTHDVLRIKLPALPKAEGEEDGKASKSGGGARFVMLPFARQFVPIIDVAAGIMKVEPPEGLFELAAPAKQQKERKESAGKRETRKDQWKQQEQAAREEYVSPPELDEEDI